MDYIILKDLIDKNFSLNKIARELNYSQTNIRYWLKKFDLRTNLSKHNKNNNSFIKEKLCSKCNIVKPIEEFYLKNSTNKKLRSGYCKKCSNTYHANRVKNIKLKMIDYKGGKCCKCDLHIKNSHYAVFEFHHINPKEKDIKFIKIKYRKWEYIIEELKKCILVCSNCHRIIHAELNNW